jgi:two-component system chemotaxis response regulator CheY
MISIFLIDDDPIYLLLARKIISSADSRFDITEFMHAEDALEFLESNKTNATLLPNIIFLDLSMPFMDGWAFLEQYEHLIPDFAKSAALYIVSSSISPEDAERAKSHEFVKDFLVKPVGRDKMIGIANVVQQ